MVWPMGVCWFVTMLAETNRTPFDFAEGESEIVSGFNIEYGAGGFAILFMAEYINIIVIRIFSVSFFCGSLGIFGGFTIGFGFEVLLLVFFFIWVRGRLPRIRYDKLINLT